MCLSINLLIAKRRPKHNKSSMKRQKKKKKIPSYELLLITLIHLNYPLPYLKL